MHLLKKATILILALVFAFLLLDSFKDKPLLAESPLIQNQEKEEAQEAQYFYELGKAYYKAGSFNEAIFFLNGALKIQPKNPDVKVFLAYALLQRNQSKNDLFISRQLFKEVLKDIPTYKDAQEGLKQVETLLEGKPLLESPGSEVEREYALGRAYMEKGDFDEAIKIFKEVLKIQPDNADVKVALAQANLKKHASSEELHESEEMLLEVLKEHPTDTDAEETLKNVENLLHPETLTPKGPSPATILYETAEELSKIGDHLGALHIYQALSKQFPDNSEYIYKVGFEFSRLELHEEAIEAYETALRIKPDHVDALVGVGYQYLNLHYLCESAHAFRLALSYAPKDIDALIGLARIETEWNNLECAEELYNQILAIDPDNISALKQLAAIKVNQLRFTEAERIYQYLAYKEEDINSYRATLFDLSTHTKSIAFTRNGLAEEKEKNLFSNLWDASIRYTNAEVGTIYPINDRLRVTLRAHQWTMKQRNLLSKTVLFDTEWDGGGIKGEWFYSTTWKIVADLVLDWTSNRDRKAILPTERDIKVEPTLVFIYTKEKDQISFGELGDTVVFRDFNHEKLRVVNREAAFATYRHNFENYKAFGAEAFWFFYQDPVNNQEQDVTGWFQVGIPYFEDLLTASYYSIYRRFRRETTGYYSFVYEFTNWLHFRGYKQWRCGIRCEAEYWHGWRVTRGRNPQQQIITTPAAALLPDVTVSNQIDWVFLTLGYNPTVDFDCYLSGSYYHDSFDYTVWLAKMGLEWHF